MDTSGFYKLDGSLLYAKEMVIGPDYLLSRDNCNNYTYPIVGWYWFDYRIEAIKFFELPPEENDTELLEMGQEINDDIQ